MRPGLWLAIALALAPACDSEDADFIVIAPDEPIELVQGQVGMIELAVERAGGFDANVVVTADGLAAGITPGAIVVRAGDSGGTLTLAVETSAVAGPLPGAELVGVAGDLERRAPLQLSVVPAQSSSSRSGGP